MIESLRDERNHLHSVRDPYEILGISTSDIDGLDDGARKKIVNTAYLNAVRELHPDFTGVDNQEVRERLTDLSDARKQLKSGNISIDEEVLRGSSYKAGAQAFDSAIKREIDEFLTRVDPEFREGVAGILEDLETFGATEGFQSGFVGSFNEQLRKINSDGKDREHIASEAEKNKATYRKPNIGESTIAAIRAARSSYANRDGQASTPVGFSFLRSDREKELIGKIIEDDPQALLQLIDETYFNSTHGSSLFLTPRAGETYWFPYALDNLPEIELDYEGQPRAGEIEKTPAFKVASKSDPKSPQWAKVLQDMIRSNFADPGFVYCQNSIIRRAVGERILDDIATRTDFDSREGFEIARALVESGSLSGTNKGLDALEKIT